MIVREKYKDRYKDILEQTKQIDSDVKILEAEKDQCVTAFVHATIPSVRESIEKTILNIDSKIKETESNRPTTATQSSQVENFISQVKFTLEHLSKLLANARDLSIRKALFSLIFDESPTYSNLKFGTPKLSLAFNVFQDSSPKIKSVYQLVRERGLEPPCPCGRYHLKVVRLSSFDTRAFL